MLEELRKALDKASKRMKELNDSVKGKDGSVRSFTEEEQAEWDKLSAECKNAREAIKRAEETEQAAEEARKLDAVVNPGSVQTVREEGHDEKGRYRGFGHVGLQLQAVCDAERGIKNPKLDKITRAAAAGQNETVLSDGGFLLQSDFTTALLESLMETSDIARLCRRVKISASSNSVEYPSVKQSSRADGHRNGGFTAYWGSEAAEYTASKAEFENNTLQLEKLMGLCHVTDEMVSDASFLTTWIGGAFNDEFDFKLQSGILEGNGIGKPFGIFNSPALVTVPKEGSQTADTVVAGNITAMRAQLLPRSWKTAVWLVNQEVWGQLPLMTIGDQPVYLPAGSLAGNTHDLLLGRPVIVCEACEKLGDAKDIVLADLNQYLLAEKGSIETATSIHVKFLTGEQSFRFTLRVNGHPLLKNKITPYKSNSNKELSAFVTVADRS